MLRVATVARRAAAGSAASAASAPRRHMSAAAAAAAGEDGGKRRRQPLKLEGNLGKYAHSLFNVAKEAKVEAKVAQDLQKIAADFAQPAFVAYLKNPVLSAADLEEKVKEWSKSPAAKGLAEPTVKLVLAMAHRGHLLNLPKVADAYRALLRDAQGIVPARVTSAIALTPKQVQALEAALKKRLDADQTVELTQVVDPSILGGLKVVLGNQFCDMSAATRLRSYDAWLRSQPYEWFDSKVKQLLQGKPLPADQLPYK